MTPLRHLLLVFALLFAQLASGAHAVEHVANQDDGLPQHVCELCLATHNLASALPSLAALPPVLALRLVPEPPQVNERRGMPVPLARQRGPPNT